MHDSFVDDARNYLAVVDLIKTAEDVRLITYEVAAETGRLVAGQRR